MKQLCNWFTNARKRLWQPLLKGKLSKCENITAYLGLGIGVNLQQPQYTAHNGSPPQIPMTRFVGTHSLPQQQISRMSTTKQEAILAYQRSNEMNAAAALLGLRAF